MLNYLNLQNFFFLSSFANIEKCVTVRQKTKNQLILGRCQAGLPPGI